jgi:hypothetical protein
MKELTLFEVGTLYSRAKVKQVYYQGQTLTWHQWQQLTLAKLSEKVIASFDGDTGILKLITPHTDKVHYFRRPQREVYHYYEVHAEHAGKCEGYQVVINFLNEAPIIHVEHNFITDPSKLTGTWCTFEVGEPITKEEYAAAYERATSHPDVKIF